MAPPFFQTHHRACAVVLASSKGSRLFPMTTKDNPKHLLPVAGIPSIVRLLESLSPFSQIVITVAEDDTKTLPTLLGNDSNSINNPSSSQQQQPSTGLFTLVNNNNNNNKSNNNASSTAATNKSCWELKSETKPGQRIYLVKLSEDCYGSVDVLRIVEETKLIDPETRIVVFPGDLVILKKNLGLLEPLIRPSSTEVACTAMLVDVLEQDEHGLPLKESAKVRKREIEKEK
jgi:hypothetical protein